MTKKFQNPEKAKAWAKFSRYIRIRDCLKTTKFAFVGVCVTCDRQFHILYLQAGHCLPGRSNAKLFDEKLVNAQCRYCNEVKNGDIKKYKRRMIDRYGRNEFEQMEIDARKVIPYMDYEKINKTYHDKYTKILHKHGFKTWSELLQS